MAEIELKFVTRQDSTEDFTTKVIPALTQLGMSVSQPQVMQLQNDYYDTRDHDFQQHKIGFRVRGNDGTFEQTLKTQGVVRGGLHERAEYNIALDNDSPDLRLFDAQVWPRGLEPNTLNAALERQFSTHFTRTAIDVTVGDSMVEVVMDNGEATTGKTQSPICEIELELKKGDLTVIFDIAEVINSILPVRVSDVSKAAQGYELLHGIAPATRHLPDFLPLHADVSTENAFIKSVQVAVQHWQHHEHLFIQTGSVKVLSEVMNSLRLLLQAVSLYLPVLQCSQLLELHQQLMKYLPQWQWQDDLQSLRTLVSKKSMFAKCLARHGSLQSYLQGRKAGLIHAHDPESLFYATESTDIKLRVTRLMIEKPWRDQANNVDMPVIEHAKGWLSQGWQTVQQSMPAGRTMAPANYESIEIVLRQTLWNGFLLASLFNDESERFRAPWLDILTGIKELKALMMLQALVDESADEEFADINDWIKEKTSSLIKVMERTRQVGMQGDIYW